MQLSRATKNQIALQGYYFVVASRERVPLERIIDNYSHVEGRRLLSCRYAGCSVVLERPSTLRLLSHWNTHEQLSSTEPSISNVEYEVEAIIDHVVREGQNMYLVRWKGFNSEEDTWEPETNLNCPSLIQAYHTILQHRGKFLILNKQFSK